MLSGVVRDKSNKTASIRLIFESKNSNFDKIQFINILLKKD